MEEVSNICVSFDRKRSVTIKMQPPSVKSIFARYTLEVCAPYIYFSPSHYTKHILERTYDHDVVLICWRKGQTTPIHDHPEGGCWMSVLQGCLEETEYARTEEAFVDLTGVKQLPAGSFGYKRGADGIHQIKACEDTVSLHVYIPSGYIARTYTPCLPAVQRCVTNEPKMGDGFLVLDA